jgi:hypothetical protein
VLFGCADGRGSRRRTRIYPRFEFRRHRDSGLVLETRISGISDALIYASTAASRRPSQDSGSGCSRFSLPVGLFHPLQHAGLARRTPRCNTELPFRICSSGPRMLSFEMDSVLDSGTPDESSKSHLTPHFSYVRMGVRFDTNPIQYLILGPQMKAVRNISNSYIRARDVNVRNADSELHLGSRMSGLKFLCFCQPDPFGNSSSRTRTCSNQKAGVPIGATADVFNTNGIEQLSRIRRPSKRAISRSRAKLAV